MKIYIYVFILVLFNIFIGRCDLPSNSGLNQQQRESYAACMDLKKKAPFINLNCQKILESFPKIKSVLNDENNGIKTLSKIDSETRKVNEGQEIKLRNLLRKLYSENKLSQN